MYEARLGPLKGTTSAQKILHGSETETREFLEGKDYHPLQIGVLVLPSRQKFAFYPYGPPNLLLLATF